MKKKRPIEKNYLRQYRLQIKPDMTIQALADLVEESNQNIQRYETMERALPMGVANKIAPHLGLDSGAMLFKSPPREGYVIAEPKDRALKGTLFQLEEKMTSIETAGKFLGHVMGCLREMPSETREKAEWMLREALMPPKQALSKKPTSEEAKKSNA